MSLLPSSLQSYIPEALRYQVSQFRDFLYEKFCDNWIETYSGAKHSLIHPQYQTIDIVDIAHALSHLCRFTGHCRFFWSVGAHSLLCYNVLLHEYPHATIEQKLGILVHDGPEAYLGDLSSPLKQIMAVLYKPLEDRHEAAIHQAFDIILTPEDEEIIKDIDTRVLLAEAEVLLPSKGKTWSFYKSHKAAKLPNPALLTECPPDTIKQVFLQTFRKYAC